MTNEMTTYNYMQQEGNAKALPMPGPVRGCGEVHIIDTDALAEAIVSAVLEWAGDDAESLAFAEELLRRTPLLEGSAA